MYLYEVGTRSSVLINQVSLFQGELCICMKLGTQSSVLINQVFLFQGELCICMKLGLG